MIPPKKSLGQNFLKSKEALRALIEAGDIQPTDTILEVGPGKGVLTAELVKLAGKVIAIEKDHRLIETLNEQFKNEIKNGKLEVIEGDVLELSTTPPRRLGTPPKLGGEGKMQNTSEYKQEFPSSPNLGEVSQGSARDGGVLPSSYKIIANIPYYITGTFLQKFLESENQPSKMVVMLQKEVAQRIVAKDGKESILSMSVKAYGNPRYVMTVKAKYFSPEPKVDSAIIAIENISKDFFRDISEEDFFKVMKAGFAHKRKMLIGNLRESDSLNFNLSHIFNEIGIPEKARAEDISISQMKKLISAIKNN